MGIRPMRMRVHLLGSVEWPELAYQQATRNVVEEPLQALVNNKAVDNQGERDPNCIKGFGEY